MDFKRIPADRDRLDSVWHRAPTDGGGSVTAHRDDAVPTSTMKVAVGILVTRCDLDPVAALALAEKVSAVIGRPRIVGGIEVSVEPSIGIALFPDDGADVETLLSRADVALHHSGKVHAPAVYERAHDRYSPSASPSSPTSTARSQGMS
jgi:hypothetical protein